ncbi:hypothetical protein EIP86_002143 [Pleurotus ostreatoroseus]|nr:hypothetical protein EIP86_002143 [Pleurotus ostreatoroseus]
MPIQSLPLEIEEMIIKSLPSKNDLSSLSRVSPNFLNLVRPRLFADIRLPKNFEDHVSTSGGPEVAEHPRGYKDFVTFLTSTPDLARFIRQLTLWGPLDRNASWSSSGSLDRELLVDIISKLPSLRTLWLHGVVFKRSDAAVQHKRESIDRLIISCTRLWEFMVPMELFTRIEDLVLLSCPIGNEIWDEGNTFDQTLVNYGISKVFSRQLQASSIYIDCYFSWDIEHWIEMFRKTPTSKVLRSFGVRCAHLTSDCHVTSTMFDFLHEAASTLTHLTLGASHTRKRAEEEEWEEELEAVVFEGIEGTTAEEKARILKDLPELREVIQFSEPKEKEKIGLLA